MRDYAVALYVAGLVLVAEGFVELVSRAWVQDYSKFVALIAFGLVLLVAGYLRRGQKGGAGS